jgi:tRNA dimethylallyltransferase
MAGIQCRRLCDLHCGWLIRDFFFSKTRTAKRRQGTSARAMMPLLAIMGPTASGKSALAMALAKRIGGEIIACDAMTVYRGLDIGTAKASKADQTAVPHHLLDILDPGEAYDAARYVADAQTAMDSCAKRNIPAILCGGSGLYARSLLYEFEPLPADPIIAADIRAEFEKNGLDGLLLELNAIDPASAERTRLNPRRVLRAVEATRILAGPIPSNRDTATLARPCKQIVLMPEADDNRQNIADRTQKMLDAGWIDETRQLIADGFLDTPTARQALGYSIIAEHLAGTLDWQTMLQRIITATCRYAKRQRTWFRNQHPGATLIPPPSGDTLSEVVTELSSQFSTLPTLNPNLTPNP